MQQAMKTMATFIPFLVSSLEGITHSDPLAMFLDGSNLQHLREDGASNGT